MQIRSDFDQVDIPRVLAIFYDKAFDDLLIGHFFFGKDKKRLIEMQTIFMKNALGLKGGVYEGKSLQKAHAPLTIGKVHLLRREKIIREVLEYEQWPELLIDRWIEMERRFYGLVLGAAETFNCRA